MYALKFDWNPITGIDIAGNFKIHFYSLMWIIAFVLGHKIMSYIFKREKIKLEYLDPLFIYTVLATMLGARLGHVIFYQPELFGQDFLSVFLPFRTKPEFELFLTYSKPLNILLFLRDLKIVLALSLSFTFSAV